MPQLGKELDYWIKQHKAAPFTVSKLEISETMPGNFTKIKDAINLIEHDPACSDIKAIFNNEDQMIMLYIQGKWISIC